MTDEKARFLAALERARASSAAGRGDSWAESVNLHAASVLSAIHSGNDESLDSFPSYHEVRFDLIIGRVGRGGPPVSFKVANVTREISRTVYVIILIGIAESSILHQSSVERVFAAIVGIAFATFNATRATFGYSDACVLHKAWKLAGTRLERTFSASEIISLKEEIVREYKAPKCSSNTEIEDAINNLCGLKAISAVGRQYHLNERIVFFEDGLIKN